MSVQGVVLLPPGPIYTVCGRCGANECSGCGIVAPHGQFILFVAGVVPMSVQGVVLLPPWPIYTVCGRGGANECSGCGIVAPRAIYAVCGRGGANECSGCGIVAPMANLYCLWQGWCQ